MPGRLDGCWMLGFGPGLGIRALSLGRDLLHGQCRAPATSTPNFAYLFLSFLMESFRAKFTIGGSIRGKVFRRHVKIAECS